MVEMWSTKKFCGPCHFHTFQFRFRLLIFLRMVPAPVPCIKIKNSFHWNFYWNCMETSWFQLRTILFYSPTLITFNTNVSNPYLRPCLCPELEPEPEPRQDHRSGSGLIMTKLYGSSGSGGFGSGSGSATLVQNTNFLTTGAPCRAWRRPGEGAEWGWPPGTSSHRTRPPDQHDKSWQLHCLARVKDFKFNTMLAMVKKVIYSFILNCMHLSCRSKMLYNWRSLTPAGSID
jgi:hypothetical protein